MDRSDSERERDRASFRRWYRLRPAAYGVAIGTSIGAVIGFALAVSRLPLAGSSKFADKGPMAAGVTAAVLVLSLAILVYLVERHQAIARILAIDYIEDLRRYAVENIDALWDEADARRTVRGASSVVLNVSAGEASAYALAADRALATPPPEHVPTVPDERGLSARERNTLLKIIYGMAKAGPYNFDPSAARSDAVAIIASATDAAGCSVSDDTVRKWLKEAARIV